MITSSKWWRAALHAGTEMSATGVTSSEPEFQLPRHMEGEGKVGTIACLACGNTHHADHGLHMRTCMGLCKNAFTHFMHGTAPERARVRKNVVCETGDSRAALEGSGLPPTPSITPQHCRHGGTHVPLQRSQRTASWAQTMTHPFGGLARNPRAGDVQCSRRFASRLVYSNAPERFGTATASA